MPTATGQFYVSNGQIIGPNGQPFVARGINVLEGNPPSAATLQADFPGINFVRLAIYDYPSPSALSAYVSQLTSAGIVVELENHNNGAGNAGGSQGTIFTGQALTNESNWYASIASAFKNNPYVWFGTNNEPSETDASGNFNPAALSSWQQATYNAIRGTGNNDPILVEMNGWSPASTGQGYTPSVYAAMKNIAWDIHYYGWLSNYSTDQNTVTQTLNGMITTAQMLKSADGTVPVAIGEYGNSTNGQTIDPNGDQVINAVQSVGLNMGVGSAAWAYGVGPGDALVNSDGSLTAYGQRVAAVIATLAAHSPSNPPPTPPSPNDTVVTAGSTAAIVDASGNTWTITSGGQVAVNGTVDRTTANVIELAYVNGVVWQENTNKLWWGKTSPSDSWSPPAGTSTSPLPPAASPSDPVNATADVATVNNDPTTANNSHTFNSVTNTSVAFGGLSNRLTFIGSSNSGVIASGQNQTVSLVNNSHIVVQNQSPTALNVLVTGADSNITINDVMHNINIVLDHQGAYTITDNAAGYRGGALINTGHSSIFVIGISAKDLIPSVTAVT
jgi:cellulase (glycosyl hydrolase family 5)